jgi:hypothetical protein
MTGSLWVGALELGSRRFMWLTETVCGEIADLRA